MRLRPVDLQITLIHASIGSMVIEAKHPEKVPQRYESVRSYKAGSNTHQRLLSMLTMS